MTTAKSIHHSLPGEARALIRQGLPDLDAAIPRAMPAASGSVVEAHLALCRCQIGGVLCPDNT